ncbi:septum site-determining protein MinC [Litorisediminicola beolgyonensis]|uniref:Probable septum site-determining protein MinC n=1 Tax=Litorisediminicola beolgyonensis TaxID=1173614 RepID=A0ABW3ZLF8_9RHOB
MTDQSEPGRSAGASAAGQLFQIRGRFLTAVALRPEDVALDDAFLAALDAQLTKTQHFFAGAPMVLDLAKAPGMDSSALPRLIEALSARELHVFGFQGATEAQSVTCRGLGLTPTNAGREAPLKGTPARTVAKRLGLENRVVTRPVRSGQLEVAERGDLTVIGSVASGAELAAAGSIHVYGALRGRAMAGVEGDETARIFCQSLDAELLAIAGLYRTSDAIEPDLRGRAVQVFLEQDTLRMESFA